LIGAIIAETLSTGGYEYVGHIYKRGAIYSVIGLFTYRDPDKAPLRLDLIRRNRMIGYHIYAVVHNHPGGLPPCGSGLGNSDLEGVILLRNESASADFMVIGASTSGSRIAGEHGVRGWGWEC
jgi:hypothetical protein